MNTVKDDWCTFLVSTTMTALRISILSRLINKCINEQKKAMMMTLIMIGCSSVNLLYFLFFYDLQRQMGFACLVYSHVWIYGWCAGAKRRCSLLSFIDIADRETCYNDDKFLLFLIISAWMHICLFSSLISIVFSHPQV
jgi:hypothetical protein